MDAAAILGEKEYALRLVVSQMQRACRGAARLGLPSTVAVGAVAAAVGIIARFVVSLAPSVFLPLPMLFPCAGRAAGAASLVVHPQWQDFEHGASRTVEAAVSWRGASDAATSQRELGAKGLRSIGTLPVYELVRYGTVAALGKRSSRDLHHVATTCKLFSW